MNNRTLLSGGADGELKMWDIYTDNCIKTMIPHKDYINCILKLDNQCIATCRNDESIKLINVYSGKLLKTMKGHKSYVTVIISL